LGGRSKQVVCRGTLVCPYAHLDEL